MKRKMRKMTGTMAIAGKMRIWLRRMISFMGRMSRWQEKMERRERRKDFI